MAAAYGIIGYPLGHTFSPGYFADKFAREGIDASYRPFPIKDIAGLPALLSLHPELKGLNVTIPHKETVIPFLDNLDDTAKEVGAVNCIRIADGRLKGYNTDVAGFEQSLLPLLKPHHNKALILGSGGSSRAVAYVLGKLGIAYSKVSRTAQPGMLTYDVLTTDILSAHTLIINTTPVGMYPDVETCPAIDFTAPGPKHLLYDLIYNPAETKFLALGRQRGAAIKNGLEMLQLQAEASWRIWND